MNAFSRAERAYLTPPESTVDEDDAIKLLEDRVDLKPELLEAHLDIDEITQLIVLWHKSFRADRKTAEAALSDLYDLHARKLAEYCREHLADAINELEQEAAQ